MDRRAFVGGLAMAALGLGANGSAAAEPAVELTIEDEDLFARCGGRPLLRYRRRVVEDPAGKNPLLASSGYLHPVQAPNGAVVTDHYSPEHPHQRGVFAAWTKTAVVLDGERLEPDFWNIQNGTGRTRSAGVEPLVTTGAAPAFRSRQVYEVRHREQWRLALAETWDVGFPPQPAADPDAPAAIYLFDLVVRQKPQVAIELPKYHYGGMAVRGSRRWATAAELVVLTSDGKDRAGADGAAARWVDMSGPVDGKQAGIALLEHPANLHAPNAVRMHPTMPYYVFALPQSGPVTLAAGKEYVFRYRVVAHNGGADRALLNGLWAELAAQKG